MESGEVEVQSSIEARLKGFSILVEPNSPQQLMRFALDFLVDQLGYDGARRFVQEELAKYQTDYRGVGKDIRPAKW